MTLVYKQSVMMIIMMCQCHNNLSCGDFLVICELRIDQCDLEVDYGEMGIDYGEMGIDYGDMGNDYSKL